MSLYISQICMLLTSLPEWNNGSFDVVGYSLGGLIATTFASFFPHRVDNLLLIAPAGLAKSQSLSFIEQLFFHGKMPLSLAKAFVGVAPIRLMRSSKLVSWQLDNHQGLVHAFAVSMHTRNLKGENTMLGTRTYCPSFPSSPFLSRHSSRTTLSTCKNGSKKCTSNSETVCRSS